MSLDAILDLCDRWAKIRIGTRGLALPYMKMLLTEMFDSIISTLEKGLIRDPAIVIGTEGMMLNDLWDMPDRHDLNSGKGNYIILCRNDFTGIVSGHGGAASGIYGMIGRWTLVNGAHWLSAQKKDTGPVCEELYDQPRTPGADFKFKSIFAWPDGTAGPEMHCQLGEGTEAIMLDLLSRTPATHHLRTTIEDGAMYWSMRVRAHQRIGL